MQVLVWHSIHRSSNLGDLLLTWFLPNIQTRLSHTVGAHCMLVLVLNYQLHSALFVSKSHEKTNTKTEKCVCPTVSTFPFPCSACGLILKWRCKSLKVGQTYLFRFLKKKKKRLSYFKKQLFYGFIHIWCMSRWMSNYRAHGQWM